MAYCELSDIQDQLPDDLLVQLTDDDDAGAMDEDIIARAIEDADAEIDGYCGKRYGVPLSPVSPIIRKFSVDIAIYNLYARRKGAPEERMDRYRNAVKFLENVARGVVSLGVSDPDGTPAASHAPDIQSSTRIFTRDKLEGF